MADKDNGSMLYSPWTALRSRCKFHLQELREIKTRFRLDSACRRVKLQWLLAENWDKKVPVIEAGADIPWTKVQQNLDATATDLSPLTYLWEKTAGNGRSTAPIPADGRKQVD